MSDERIPNTGDTHSARDRFATDLQTLSNHAQELMSVTNTVSGEGIAAAREQLRETLHSAGETLKRVQADAMGRGRVAVKQADSYVHDNPWQSIAMGMAAGIAIGLAARSMTRGSDARV